MDRSRDVLAEVTADRAGLLLLLGPVFFFFGSFTGDLWVVSMAVLLLLRSSFGRRAGWRWARHPWVLAALLFWLIAMTSALLSAAPSASLWSAFSWVRFPLAAAAVLVLVEERPERFSRVLVMAFTVAAFMTLSLFVDRAMNPDAGKLYVFYGNHAEAAWISRATGFLPACLALGFFARARVLGPLALSLAAFSALWFLSFTLAGEVYITLALALGFLVFAGTSRLLVPRILVPGCLMAVLIACALLVYEPIYIRFVEHSLPRLPWMPTSDYYAAWIGGLKTGLSNPLLGAGPEQFYSHCKTLEAAVGLEALGVDRCAWHPHNTFIQIFAETGVPGLAAYVAALILMAAATLRGRKALSGQGLALMGAGFATVFLYLWPLSTYSDAFEQQMNGLTWFSLGLALAAAAAARNGVTYGKSSSSD